MHLCRVLESEEGRREYLAFPTSKSPGGGQKGRKDLLKGNGRRIDYLLHGEEGLAPDWKAVSQAGQLGWWGAGACVMSRGPSKNHFHCQMRTGSDRCFCPHRRWKSLFLSLSWQA